MATPQANAFVKTNPTFFKAIRPSDTTESTTSTSYIDVPNFGSIASVPNNSKLISAIRMTKSVAGNALFRWTDGTTTFKEFTHSTADTFSHDIDGSSLQDSGGAATVKAQFKSSDGNNVTIIPQQCFLVATDGDAPMVLVGPLGNTTVRIPIKASVLNLYMYYGNNRGVTTDIANVNGILSFEEALDNVVKSSELTAAYANESILNYFEIDFENAMVIGQFLIVDWSGHGVSFS